MDEPPVIRRPTAATARSTRVRWGGPRSRLRHPGLATGWGDVALAGEEREHYDQDSPEEGHRPTGLHTDAGAARDQNATLRAVVDAATAAVEEPIRHTDPEAAELLRERVRLLERLGGVATAGLATTLADLDETGVVEADGASSTAAWVTANTGRSGREGARLSRFATDLHHLPRTRDALKSGDLSVESVDAIVGAARDGRLGPPIEVDDALVEVARASSPEKLRSHIRARQQAADAGANARDERRQHARRRFRLSRTEAGTWRASGELPDELGQRFRTLLDAFEQPDPKGTPRHQRRRPEVRQADALSDLVDAALDGGLAPGTGGIARPHLSVIVDARTVSADLADLDRAGAESPTDPAAAPANDDPRWSGLPGGDLPWGGTLSPQAVRRICCDAAVSRIVMDGASQVLDVGRATRDWSGPQRRAVNARDRGCRGPTCDRPIAWTSIHHVTWWSRHGPTSVDNGLALCHHCHRLVHEADWRLVFDPATGQATWTSPSGEQIITTPHRSAGGVPASP